MIKRKQLLLLHVVVLATIITTVASLSLPARATDDPPGEIQIPPKDGGGGGTIYGVGGSGTTNYIPKFTSSTNLGNSIIYEDAGKIGIGLTDPSAPLDIAGNQQVVANFGTDPAAIRLGRPSNAFVGGYYGSSGNHSTAYLSSNIYYDAGATGNGWPVPDPNDNTAVLLLQNGGLSLYTGTTDLGTPKLIVNNNGNVGIGTTTPGKTLDVNGNFRVSSGDLFSPNRFAFLTDGSAAQTIMAGALAITNDYNNTPPGNGLLVGGNTALGTNADAADYRLTLGTDSGFEIGTAGIDNLNITTESLVGGAIGLGPRNDTSLFLDTDGEVGVGTLVPGSKLHVLNTNGTRTGRFESTSPDATVFEIANTTSTTWEASVSGSTGAFSGTVPAGSLYFLNQSRTSPDVVLSPSGTVGIGTASPVAKVNIDAGNRAGDDKLLTLSRGPEFGLTTLSQYYGDPGNAGLHISTGGKDNAFTILNANGNVGIGTTTPGYPLDVYGVSRLATAPLGGGAITTEFLGYPNRGALVFDSDRTGYNFVLGNRRVADGDILPIITMTDSGSVGIGTSAPSQKLDVAGYVKGQTGLCIGDDCRTSWPSGSGGTIGGSGSTNYIPKFTGSTSIGNSTIYESSANVGIGSTNPTARLEIGGSGNFKLKANVNDPGDIIFEDGGGMQKGRIWAEPAAGVAGLQFSSSDTTPDIAIDASGNIGIGTTSPGAKLDVNGTTKTKVLTITGGADLAEPFTVRGKTPKPGTVLTLDADHPGELRIATSAYDTTVAGIVSGANGVAPGILLRHETTPADGTVPVALSGRVYALADASFGSIRVGDLLVTSPTTGHLMRAESPSRAAGAVIGKAMTGLAKGRGYVLVLVSLQ